VHDRKVTTITIPVSLRKKLDTVPGRTMAEKLELLLSVFEEYRKSYAKKVVCNDLKSREMYLRGWFRVLKKKLGGDDALVEYALGFLKVKGVEGGEPVLAVDEEKCRGGAP